MDAKRHTIQFSLALGSICPGSVLGRPPEISAESRISQVTREGDVIFPPCLMLSVRSCGRVLWIHVHVYMCTCMYACAHTRGSFGMPLTFTPLFGPGRWEHTSLLNQVAVSAAAPADTFSLIPPGPSGCVRELSKNAWPENSGLFISRPQGCCGPGQR